MIIQHQEQIGAVEHKFVPKHSKDYKSYARRDICFVLFITVKTKRNKLEHSLSKQLKFKHSENVSHLQYDK